MYWNPGDAFRPKIPLTQLLRSLRVTEQGRGFVTFIDANGISFYLERGIPGADYFEAQCHLGLFVANFDRDPLLPNSWAYHASKHFPKVFPDSFRSA